MLSRVLVLIVIFSLFPAELFAQEEEPQFTQLEEGEPAPFTGTLFNPTATAQLIADREFRLTDCDLRVNYEINLLTAPFTGTLFNPTATAQLIADREFRLTDCDLRVNYEINLLTARHELEYNLLQVRYDSLEERTTALSQLKDQEIADLQEMVRKHPNRHSHWFFAGGFVAGAVASIAIFFAAREITQGSQ